MQRILNFLQGKKTYIIIIVGAILNIAVQAGWVGISSIETVNIVLGFLGLGAIRAGISKV